MSDFCSQCSDHIFGHDFRDLAIEDDDRIDTDPVAQPSDRYVVMCEGCCLEGCSHDPVTIVDRDGKCVAACSERHGDETFESVQAGQVS